MQRRPNNQFLIEILNDYESGTSYKQLQVKYNVSQRAIARYLTWAREINKRSIIRVVEVDHSQQRYDTVGDWQWINGCLEIKVSRTSDQRYSYLLALHEMIEAILCRYAGISEADVDIFDVNYIGIGEPGDHEQCPYRQQHKFALSFEHCLSQELKVNWAEYEKEIDSL